MKKPEFVKNGISFYPVTKVTDSELEYGASQDKFFKLNEIPVIPKNFIDKSIKIFYEGGVIEDLNNKINRTEINRFVGAICEGVEITHKQRVMTLAYAIMIWTCKNLP